uniref:Uncharacterized protein n=1 Tax=Stomoxys calcitrans TaxID=35570 RepID=A0A1I8QF77_STOCA
MKKDMQPKEKIYTNKNISSSLAQQTAATTTTTTTTPLAVETAAAREVAAAAAAGHCLNFENNIWPKNEGQQVTTTPTTKQGNAVVNDCYDADVCNVNSYEETKQRQNETKGQSTKTGYIFNRHCYSNNNNTHTTNAAVEEPYNDKCGLNKTYGICLKSKAVEGYEGGAPSATCSPPSSSLALSLRQEICQAEKENCQHSTDNDDVLNKNLFLPSNHIFIDQINEEDCSSNNNNNNKDKCPRGSGEDLAENVKVSCRGDLIESQKATAQQDKTKEICENSQTIYEKIKKIKENCEQSDKEGKILEILTKIKNFEEIQGNCEKFSNLQKPKNTIPEKEQIHDKSAEIHNSQVYQKDYEQIPKIYAEILKDKENEKNPQECVEIHTNQEKQNKNSHNLINIISEDNSEKSVEIHEKIPKIYENNHNNQPEVTSVCLNVTEDNALENFEIYLANLRKKCNLEQNCEQVLKKLPPVSNNNIELDYLCNKDTIKAQEFYAPADSHDEKPENPIKDNYEHFYEKFPEIESNLNKSPATNRNICNNPLWLAKPKGEELILGPQHHHCNQNHQQQRQPQQHSQYQCQQQDNKKLTHNLNEQGIKGLSSSAAVTTIKTTTDPTAIITNVDNTKVLGSHTAAPTPLIVASRHNEVDLNPEEFVEASQRLKRLLLNTIPLKFQQQQQTSETTTTTTTTNTSAIKQVDEVQQQQQGSGERTPSPTRTPKSLNLVIKRQNIEQKDNKGKDKGKALELGGGQYLPAKDYQHHQSLPPSDSDRVVIVVKNAIALSSTKANKLQADCETTLERSFSCKHQQQQQQEGHGILTHKSQGTNNTPPNTNSHNSCDESPKEHEVKQRPKEKPNETNNKEQQEKEVEEIENTKGNFKNNILSCELQRTNSPQAYVTAKVVRLRQNKPNLGEKLPTLQQQQRQQQQQPQELCIGSEIATATTTAIEHCHHHYHHPQHPYNSRLDNANANIGFPLEEDKNNNDSTLETYAITTSPTKRCNLNLQHIVNTRELLRQQEEEQQQQQETQLSSQQAKQQEIAIRENPQGPFIYKSAFVPTKPEIESRLIPRRSNGNTANETLSAITGHQADLVGPAEFDTKRFSEFLQQQSGNPIDKAHVQLEHLATSVVVGSSNSEAYYSSPPLIYHCYDELLLEQESQQLNQNSLRAFLETNSSTVASAKADTANDDADADNQSISSTTSSPCDCLNCQLEEDEANKKQFADPLTNINNNNTPPLPPKFVTPTYGLVETLKMREVNGQLRGLLKKPNRPPPARKNRVVFDETRNEFFEADYIILIREDCAYDEEDEEPCTCGEHELVRLCCEEGCQCNYSTTAPATTDENNRTPQSPKFAPPIEFVDEAALSPPDGYKDNGLKNTLGGALSGHIFGAQHLQQLQVIQRLQQQRAAMLAARNNTQIPPPPPPVNQQHPSSPASAAAAGAGAATATPNSTASATTVGGVIGVGGTGAANNANVTTIQLQQHSPDDDTQGVCTECAECAECAAKQLQQDTECHSPQCQEDLTSAPLGVPAVAILPLHTSSPERRITQKEIIAGEERPRYVLQAQYKSSPVTERRIVREATEDMTIPHVGGVAAGLDDDDENLVPPALPAKPATMQSINNVDNNGDNSEKPPPIPPKESSPTTQISGILKGGKLWKQDSISQSDDQNNTTSEDEAGSTSNTSTKRSVRFVTEDLNNSCDDIDGASSSVDDVNDNQINELIPIKKHSTLFKNALRPNSAVQQLFPSSVAHQTLTSEALRAFDESKRAGSLVSTLPGAGAGDSDTLRRSMERNILRRSLIKKKAVKSDISLEDRIRQLTCGIDEDNDESNADNGDDDFSKSEDGTDFSHRDSPAGEENPQKFTGNGAANNSDKSFSPNSSVSSSSSGSSAYKKITEIFNRDKKSQEKIMEMEENPIVIIPQECRCPAAPDLGMGVQVPVVHTQIHRTPPRQTEPKRQFLSTLAPLTACVAGNKDDLSSYYTLAAAHHNQAAQHIHASEYNLAALVAGEQNSAGLVGQGVGDEVRKVAPDVIAGTPGQEPQDELAAFAQQEANRTEKIKKRYGNEATNAKESKEKEKEKERQDNSDDDEGNDYGFNKRPSVRGIKPKFSSTNEILQQMQEQLTQQMPSVAQSQALPQAMKSYTLPKQSSTSAMSKQIAQQQQPSPQNVPHPTMVANAQTQLPQQQQLCSAVVPQNAIQLPANATIAQQQTEQRTWSFYTETAGGAGGEPQRLPVETAAAAMQQTYYQTLPAGAMFRHTMIHQQQGPDEALMYAQNCQAMATTLEPQAPQPHYGHYARSPTRRPESPPPLRNYHQTMVLIPYNAETYSQFAATNIDPKMAHMAPRQNILEYQQVGEMTQVTQQTIRVPIGYALPGMQLHVVAGRGQHTTAQYGTAPAAATHHHQHQRIMTQRYQFAQDATMAGFSERGVPEGAAAVSHSDCTSSGMVSPTSGQPMTITQQQQQSQPQQQQQNTQMAQQQQHQQ